MLLITNSENHYQKTNFGISKYLWTEMNDRHIAKFHEKLSHTFFNNNLGGSKWKLKVQKFCDNCGEIGNVKYLIYECSDSYLTW